MHLLVLILCSI